MIRVSVLVLGVLIVLCPLSAQSHTELFAAGKAALEKNEDEKAAGLFEKAVAAQPNNAEYHYYLGSAYGEWAQSAGMLKKASLAKKVKASFERAVQLNPRHFEARFGLITFYLVAPGFMGGSEEKALEQAAEMKKLDPLMGHRAFARVYRSQKKNDLARKEMIDAVREQPTSAAAHFYLGNAYFSDKDYKQALHEYEYALKLDANYLPAVFRIGVVAAESNTDHARGEASLKRYLAHKPDVHEPSLALAWFYLGKLYEKQGRKADAKSAYLAAQKLVPEQEEVKAALKRVQ
ncbi:MAG TPA: tetratricopeptide repeat protein [Thermoanaerobaculia bacterium]|jgi:tetratricopeptide (TPR) repeat protein|nr:tetratricopeptide repeat protein [Thermoanaerobaculia bacterium]